MREQKIDVDITVPRQAIVEAGGFEANIETIIRRSRDKASEGAEKVGGIVRATVNPEIVVSEAISPILGEVFVIATRWVCDVPDGAFTPAQR